MTSVSATFNTSAVNIIDVSVNGSTYHVLYVDSGRNLRLSRGMLTSDGTAIIGTSATVN